MNPKSQVLYIMELMSELCESLGEKDSEIKDGLEDAFNVLDATVTQQNT